jgi:hypothetical protein
MSSGSYERALSIRFPLAFQKLSRRAYINPLSVCAATPRRHHSLYSSIQPDSSPESYMYIGGGILGTILVIVLIVYFVRRV